MPILEHLEELRRRLFVCAIAVLVGGIVAYVLFTMVPGFDLLNFMTNPVKPYLPPGQKLIVTGAGDIFQMQLNAGFFIAMVIASPVIFYQIWGFIAPAMYAKEKKLALPIILGAVTLFLLGVALAFFVVLPFTMKFFLGIKTEAAVPMLTLKDFISLEIFMCVGFGLAFQFPIVIMGLAAIGFVSPQFLAKGRRFAIIGVLIVSAAITADPTTLFLVAIPLYVLYEFSILMAKMIYRWRERRERGEDSNDTDDGPPQREDPFRLDSAY